ncbi:MAG: hypothetical protein ABEH43_09765 [Flavobacteriales bacterium]
MSKGEYKTLFPKDGTYKMSGWHVAPGMTYSLTRIGERSETINPNDEGSFQATFNPGGEIGWYLEGGRFHILKNLKFFNYFDYSLGVKQLKGKEAFEAIPNTSLDGDEYIGKGAFNDVYVTASANISKNFQIADRDFIQTSIGVNADYNLFGSRSKEGYIDGMELSKPPDFMGQLHFKLGYGMKVSEKVFIIPSLETPIMNIQKWENGKSTLEHFSSRYRPLIFSLRILWLKETESGECPEAIDNADTSEGGEHKEEEGLNYKEMKDN